MSEKEHPSEMWLYVWEGGIEGPGQPGTSNLIESEFYGTQSGDVSR